MSHCLLDKACLFCLACCTDMYSSQQAQYHCQVNCSPLTCFPHFPVQAVRWNLLRLKLQIMYRYLPRKLYQNNFFLYLGLQPVRPWPSHQHLVSDIPAKLVHTICLIIDTHIRSSTKVRVLYYYIM